MRTNMNMGMVAKAIQAARRRDEAGLAVASRVGGQIMRARKAAGLRQVDLAEKLATSQGTIARLEGGRGYPGVRMLARIAEATGRKLVIELREKD